MSHASTKHMASKQEAINLLLKLAEEVEAGTLNPASLFVEKEFESHVEHSVTGQFQYLTQMNMRLVVPLSSFKPQEVLAMITSGDYTCE